MITLTKTIDILDSNTPIKIRLMSDLHLGYKHTDYKKFKKDINDIKQDENHYFVLLGDQIEAINRRDKRHKAEDEADFLHGKNDIITEQMTYLQDNVSPVIPKCLSVLTGNHEESLLHYSERDVSYELSRMSDERLLLGVCGFLKILFKANNKTRKTLTLFLSHGYGGGVLKGAHSLALERLFMWYDCDAAFLGHRHVRQRIENVQLIPHVDRVKSRTRLAAFCGTYRQEYLTNEIERSYVAKKGLPPSNVGGYVLEVLPMKDQIRLVEDLV